MLWKNNHLRSAAVRERGREREREGERGRERKKERESERERERRTFKRPRMFTKQGCIRIISLPCVTVWTWTACCASCTACIASAACCTDEPATGTDATIGAAALSSWAVFNSWAGSWISCKYHHQKQCDVQLMLFLYYRESIMVKCLSKKKCLIVFQLVVLENKVDFHIFRSC